MASCPKCGKEIVVRNGSRTVVATRIVDDRVVRDRKGASRFLCRSCGHVFVERVHDEDAVDARLVEAALKEGVAAAAMALGCNEKRVRSTLRKWVEAHEGELGNDLPETVAMHILEVGGRERIAVSDLQNDRLLDVVEGKDELPSWLSTRNTVPTLVVVPLDAGLRSKVLEALPDVEIAVGRDHARSAIAGAGQSALRAIVRDGVERGRNFREDPAMLVVADVDLDPVAQDELAMWTREALRLRRCVLDLLAAIDGADANDFGKAAAVWRDALSAASPIVVLLRNWGAEMMAGVREKWIDDACRRMARIVDAVRLARPRIGLDVLRGVLVMSGSSERGLVLRPFVESQALPGVGFDAVDEAMLEHWRWPAEA